MLQMSFRKRELERLVLYRFLELHPDPPEGDVKRGESPDFTIGRVGIEITQHFWDASAQGSVSKRVAALRKDARKAAQEEWLRRGGRRVGLVVGWNERLQPPTTDMDRAEFAKRLADAVEVLDRQGIPGLDNAHARRSAWHSLPKELRPPEVTYVYELPHTDSWESSIGGAIPRLSVEHVQDAVDRKEPLLSRYREGCDKYGS
jgi:hypothetical protein